MTIDQLTKELSRTLPKTDKFVITSTSDSYRIDRLPKKDTTKTGTVNTYNVTFFAKDLETLTKKDELYAVIEGCLGLKD